jgi:hypothetical protein
MEKHVGKYQRVFPEGLRKLHVLPRIFTNVTTGQQDADMDYAYYADLRKQDDGRLKPDPKTSFIKPGPYALFLANLAYEDGKVVNAKMDYFGKGLREEDMSLDPETGNLLVWVFDRLEAVKDNTIFYFYAIDHLPLNEKGELDVASLAKTLNKQMQNQFERGVLQAGKLGEPPA